MYSVSIRMYYHTTIEEPTDVHVPNIGSISQRRNVTLQGTTSTNTTKTLQRPPAVRPVPVSRSADGLVSPLRSRAPNLLTGCGHGEQEYVHGKKHTITFFYTAALRIGFGRHRRAAPGGVGGGSLLL
ncbi:MYND domain containing 12 protein [Anopheles sinensis]|uniref:MYND domain containing 12 protein n=1 Tax=Anopheles sinensis TaxID=74873 RepID=A0A084WFK8_ANOSI|nr:MYND domain containing 12 protein [Anopheles sinensis]